MSSTAVVLATGFAQPAKISNGMRKIKNALPGGVWVELHSYKEHEDIPQIAAALSTFDRIILVGHSFGGWFCVELAEALDGIASVAAMLLADPVTRPPGGALSIPPNVRSVSVWRKRKGVIPTAGIVWDGPLKTTTVGVHHAKVDEDEGFQAAVIAAALSP